MFLFLSFDPNTFASFITFAFVSKLLCNIDLAINSLNEFEPVVFDLVVMEFHVFAPYENLSQINKRPAKYFTGKLQVLDFTDIFVPATET